MCHSRKTLPTSGRQNNCRRSAGTASLISNITTGGNQGYQAQKEQQSFVQQMTGLPTEEGAHKSGSNFANENNEALDKGNIAPPSYDTVVHDPPVSVGLRRAESIVTASSASSSESEMCFTPPPTVQGEDGSPGEYKEKPMMHGTWASKREMKKAYKAARKAEKWTMKARERGYVF